MLRNQGPLLGFRDEFERLEGAGVVGTGLTEDALELLEDRGLEVDVPPLVLFRLADASDAAGGTGCPPATRAQDGGQPVRRSIIVRGGDLDVATKAGPCKKSVATRGGLIG